MTRLMAIEGAWSEDFDVYWAPVAIEINNKLVNSVTRREYSVEDLDILTQEGAITPIHPLAIEDEDIGSPLVAVVLREASSYYSLLKVDKGRHGGMLLSQKANDLWFYVYRNSKSFEGYVKEVIARLLRRIFSIASPQAEYIEYVHLGLTLDPTHPYLNALRVFLGDRNSEALTRLARANTRGARGATAFEEMLNALNNDGKRYALKYEHGIAAGGGLDVDNAARLLSSISRLHPKLKTELKQNYPFLPPPPAPRFSEMHGHSAELIFAPDVVDTPLGERVARYLELRLLEQVLRGDLPDKLAGDADFERQLESIVQPAADTSLRQKPLEKQDLQSVVIREAPEGKIFTNYLDVFAVHTGVFRDAKQIELRIFPGAWGRLFLSTINNGDGNAPSGVAFLEDRKVNLYRLCHARLRWDRDETGREKYYLVSLTRLGDAAEFAITAAPSAIVERAYCLLNGVGCRLSGRAFYVLGRLVIGDYQETQASSTKLIAAFKNIIYRSELDPLLRSGWLPPPRRPTVTSLDRALLTLNALGGTAPVNRLADEISRLYNVQVRVNNTRREVLHHRDLLGFTDEQQTIVGLTEEGKARVQVYHEILARMQPASAND